MFEIFSTLQVPFIRKKIQTILILAFEANSAFVPWKWDQNGENHTLCVVSYQWMWLYLEPYWIVLWRGADTSIFVGQSVVQLCSKVLVKENSKSIIYNPSNKTTIFIIQAITCHSETKRWNQTINFFNVKFQNYLDKTIKLCHVQAFVINQNPKVLNLRNKIKIIIHSKILILKY